MRWLLCFLLAVLQACGTTALQRQALAASAFAETIDAVTVSLKDEYEHRRNVAIDEACLGVRDGYESSCKDAAREADAGVVHSWRKVWSVHDLLRITHDSWADSVLFAAASGDLSDSVKANWRDLVAQLVKLYNELAIVLRDLDVKIPKLPLEMGAITEGGER